MIYGGAGQYVFSIEEVSGQNFAPATGGTYTFTQQALDLPEDYKIKSLVELGNNLMCGTWQGTNIYDLKIADIFPWDRSSPSFFKPIQIAEHGVNAMLTIGNVIYVLAGIGGAVYKTDGVNVYQVAQVPESITSIIGSNKYMLPYPGAIVNYKGRPFFGLSNSAAAMDGAGVWSLLETSAGTILNFEHEISAGETGVNNVVNIGALLPISRDEILAGWQDLNGSAFGIDKTTNTSYTTSYGGYFTSPLYTIGTMLSAKEYSQIEFQLAKELAANEGVKLEFRINLTDSWTTIGTYTFAALGAVTAHNVACPIPASDKLQLRVSLTGTTTTPHFKHVILS